MHVSFLNRNKILSFIHFTFRITFTLSSCSDDDEEIDLQDNTTLFIEMQEALGGVQNIDAVSYIQYQSIGTASEFQEDPEPVNGKVADYSYSLIYNLDGAQSKQDWNVQAEYAYSTNFAFVETIDETRGKSQVSTGTFPAHFGSFGVLGDPTKLAA